MTARWERNVGTDGGQTLTWTGRIAVIGAVTTAWDAAHGVVSVMGDRFVLIRSDSTAGRVAAGRMAIRNTGAEKAMRAEIAAAVGGIIGHIDTNGTYAAAGRGDGPPGSRLPTSSPTPEPRSSATTAAMSSTPMPRKCRPGLPSSWRRWCAAVSPLAWSRAGALRLAMRCARDSIPQLRLKILLDLASNPRSRAADVCQRIIKPHRTVRRELEALNTLGLLHEEQEQSIADESKIIWRYWLAEDKLDRETLLAMVHPAPF